VSLLYLFVDASRRGLVLGNPFLPEGHGNSCSRRNRGTQSRHTGTKVSIWLLRQPHEPNSSTSSYCPISSAPNGSGEFSAAIRRAAPSASP
jgi:hypothetical protein